MILRGGRENVSGKWNLSAQIIQICIRLGMDVTLAPVCSWCITQGYWVWLFCCCDGVAVDMLNMGVQCRNARCESIEMMDVGAWKLGSSLGMLAKGSPIILHCMQNHSGSSAPIGWIFWVTGLYFFFCTANTDSDGAREKVYLGDNQGNWVVELQDKGYWEVELWEA